MTTDAPNPSRVPDTAGVTRAADVTDAADQRESRGPNRRRVLTGTAAGAAAGLVVGAGGGVAGGRAWGSATAGGPAGATLDTAGASGGQTVAFYGRHQPGVETPPQAHARFVALDLRRGVGAADAVRMLRLLSDDAAALMAGRAPLADSEPELAGRPARLSITFGFGPGLVSLAGPRARPAWLAPLPAFPVDRLQKSLSRGDLLLQVCCEDPLTLSHAVRMLLKDARSFARIAWTQAASRRAYGTDPAGTTIRNPFGQVDGTANPVPGTPAFDRLVWGESSGGAEGVDWGPRGQPPADLGAGLPKWLHGGTTLVLRDIAMNMATWDEADGPAREFSVGRRLSNGAPLTGREEHDVPDLGATDSVGFTVISPSSHVARSRNESDPAEQIFRRVYAYQDVMDEPVHVPRSVGAETADEKRVQDIEFDRTGLMFASFQADVTRQFLPIQRRLGEVDLLNQWTTPIGSTVWAIPPGAAGAGDYVGSTLFG